MALSFVGTVPVSADSIATDNTSDTSIAETEPNNSASTANDLAINETINGTMQDGNDQDWYRLTLSTTQRISITVNNDPGTEGKWTAVLAAGPVGQYTIKSHTWEASATEYTEEGISLEAGTYYIRILGGAEGLHYSLTVGNGVVPAVTVTFDTQGGNDVVSQKVAKGSTVSIPEPPTREGYAFTGWYTAAELGDLFDFDVPVKQDMTVYAHWSEIKTPEPELTSPFSDVVKGVTPHYADILWLADRQITTGFSDGTYRGMNAVNRQDMAAFLYRLAGSPAFTPDWSKNPFKDVNEGSAHAKEVLWLASTGITKGYPDGTFGGMRPVVRQDMAAFLHRLADYEKADDPSGEAKEFTDVTDRTPHAGDIAWLSRTGVTTGYGDGSFRGMTAVYRQDMAAFLHRMKDNVLK
ncbi:S-layer homology domain-containing protein [Bifidobacterium miconisargentati]|uniref:S-layer homology domain-containing protein n=1 Tax=Bifidobacterium miconisargentati TaxID=2834437 RepID=UPI001BDCD6CB|nr:S-layer homology domain-containing protein [Bifidobacterium miconisargentati]MBW3091138.1 S-layer homology domain-containing protein [Bifidobacterium miconisargentati]